MKNLLLVLFSLTLTACTDAEWEKNIGKLGTPASITCYSGGKVIFQDRSTGAVSRSDGGADGWMYRSKDGKYKEVSADCILEYDN